MPFADGDSSVVGRVEKGKLHVVSSVELLAVEQIRDEHLEEDAVRHDASFEGSLAREVAEASARPLFEIDEILLVAVAVLVAMVPLVDGIDDTRDLGIVAALSDDFRGISAFRKKPRIAHRYHKVRIDEFRGFLRALEGARENERDREVGEVRAGAISLASPAFGEPATLALPDALRIQPRLAMADEVEAPRAHPENKKKEKEEG